MTIERFNPTTMYHNPAWTQVLTVSGGSKLVFVSGQNGIDTEGNFVGKDIASQSAQAYRNIVAGLEAAGATMADVIKMTVYIVHGQSLDMAFGAAMGVAHELGLHQSPPAAVTAIAVSGMANPDALIELEVIAAISTEAD
jgi:enamine deaminase RidA (YjgF/YER057c/UK114 family)